MYDVKTINKDTTEKTMLAAFMGTLKIKEINVIPHR
jgi:hypothetical protein